MIAIKVGNETWTNLDELLFSAAESVDLLAEYKVEADHPTSEIQALDDQASAIRNIARQIRDGQIVLVKN